MIYLGALGRKTKSDVLNSQKGRYNNQNYVKTLLKSII